MQCSSQALPPRGGRFSPILIPDSRPRKKMADRPFIVPTPEQCCAGSTPDATFEILCRLGSYRQLISTPPAPTLSPPDNTMPHRHFFIVYHCQPPEPGARFIISRLFLSRLMALINFSERACLPALLALPPTHHARALVLIFMENDF